MNNENKKDRFEEYWTAYGKFHAFTRHGDIKVFAKDIWLSAWEDALKIVDSYE